MNVIDEYPRQEEHIKKSKVEEINYIVVHHTVSDDLPLEADYKKLLKYFASKNNHITPGKPLPSPAYHELMEVVDNEVVFFDLSYPDEIVYHVGKWNSECYGLSVNQLDYEELTVEEYNKLVSRLSELCIQFNINPICIRGHRELEGTGWFIQNNKFKLRKTCPGFVNLNMLRYNVIQSLKRMGWFNLEFDMGNKQYIKKDFVNGINRRLY